MEENTVRERSASAQVPGEEVVTEGPRRYLCRVLRKEGLEPGSLRVTFSRTLRWTAAHSVKGHPYQACPAEPRLPVVRLKDHRASGLEPASSAVTEFRI